MESILRECHVPASMPTLVLSAEVVYHVHQGCSLYSEACTKVPLHCHRCHLQWGPCGPLNDLLLNLFSSFFLFLSKLCFFPLVYYFAVLLIIFSVNAKVRKIGTLRWPVEAISCMNNRTAQSESEYTLRISNSALVQRCVRCHTVIPMASSAIIFF